MNLEMNAEEILEIACQIERDGAAFYRRAAAILPETGAKEMLEELAQMEDDHEIAFEHFRADPAVLAELLGDPEGEACQYLRAIASSHVFSGDDSPANMLTEDADVQTVLKIAINLEIASIVFYQGIRELLARSDKSGKLESIIKEEMRHVTMLSRRLARTSRPAR